MQVDERARNVLHHAARQALGDEAAEVLMASLPPYPSGELVTVGHLETEMRVFRAELRQEMSELREELRGEMSELRSDMALMRGEMGQLKGDVCAAIAGLRTEIHSLLRTQTLALIGLIAALQGAFAAVIALG